MAANGFEYLSVGDVLGRFADKAISPVEHLTSLIARAEAVNPAINAYTETFFDEALAQAEKAEARYAQGTARPLDGLPVAVKDAQRVAGQRTTQGAWLMGHEVETTSEPMIERSQPAGMTPLATSTAIGGSIRILAKGAQSGGVA